MADMPYSFYMLLPVLVCLTAVVAFTKARKARLEFWKWAFGVIAALYNPFVPVHLGDKDLWTIVNICDRPLDLGRHALHWAVVCLCGVID
jgi:hypothetical protein